MYFLTSRSKAFGDTCTHVTSAHRAMILHCCIDTASPFLYVYTLCFNVVLTVFSYGALYNSIDNLSTASDNFKENCSLQNRIEV
jgi:hypothetical protein